MNINYQKIHHIQICIPKGAEDKGREFYCNILGLKEIPKPKALLKNGGFWVKIADIELHIGTEKWTEQNSKRHPCFEVSKIEDVKNYLIDKHVKIKEDTAIPGIKRFSFYDFLGNRIEFMEKI